ncbi:cytochrome c biogenesis protein DipZ [Gordonia sp. HY002]|uniref:cytochrome c biogenesis protein DipZ n=1 Tax=Gordonia zhenghanii TaxID=2911516 RepID=UPI001EF089E1|nr:cytochrome c biogenesis protein DipZ [Gordonia zhenghanii]MCF8570520.1 cytochrome c biogenesis protein DipZ [Gordonia zhenghanii]MCF8602523.1 cytochrome c biogenesis protein DipZ [Gordonia zhenghanii]
MLSVILVGLAGGLVTGVSPCVLPMLPIVFVTGGSGRTVTAGAPEGDPSAAGTTTLAPPKAPPRSRLRTPLIIAGIVTSFSVISLFGTLLLSALGLPDSFLRWTGIVLLVAIGVGLVVPPIAHALERPFARIPAWTKPSEKGGPYLLGIGLGTLYVPCAGPVLAAIAVAGATGQIGWRTVVLTIAFAVGAALPLAVFAAAGERLGRRLAAYRSRQRTFRTIGGVVLIALAVALAFDAPARLQAALPGYTAAADRALSQSDAVDTALGRDTGGAGACIGEGSGLADCGTSPGFDGGGTWFNTADGAPLTRADLANKVVLVDFWTYSCINCLRDGPHVRRWYDAYRDAGLVVVGVHTPEFAFEKDGGNVAAAIGDEHIDYPVVQDNDYAIWNAFANRYWPAKYLIDGRGEIRAASFGEGRYDEVEADIRTLLKDANPNVTLPAPVDTKDDAVPTGAQSPEMYLSPGRSAASYAGSDALEVGTGDFTFGDSQPADTFSLSGRFEVTDESVIARSGARVRLVSTADDVNAVLAGSGRVVVHQDGRPDRSVDVSGVPRLYRLADGGDRDRTLTFDVPDGVAVYTFTFG